MSDAIAKEVNKEQRHPCVECGKPLTLAEIKNEKHQGFCSHHCALTCVGFVVTDNGYLPKDEAEYLL